MKVLAIDTSNYCLGVAIIDEDNVIGEYITNVKVNHSVRAMPSIEKLMKDCSVKPNELSKIVVARGPGSYTGVRIGVSIAKTLAWSLNIPLVGVSSLETLASSAARYFQGVVSPIFDARRGQVYTGLYKYNEGKLSVLEGDQLILSKEWATQLKLRPEKILFVGNDLPLHRDGIADILGEQAVFAELTEHNPRPAELAFLGKDLPGEDIHSFIPNYIRLAEAEAKWLEANKEKHSF